MRRFKIRYVLLGVVGAALGWASYQTARRVLQARGRTAEALEE